MDKIEILAEIKKRFYKLGEVTQADASKAGQAVRKREGIVWYLVGVYERNGDALLRRNISIYIENEGKDNEQAFYAEKEPENMLAKPATDEWAGVDGEVERRGEDWAVVKQFKIDRIGGAVEQKFLVKKVKDKFVYHPLKELSSSISSVR